MVTDSIIIIIVYFTKAATYVLICSCFGEINDDDDNTLEFSIRICKCESEL